MCVSSKQCCVSFVSPICSSCLKDGLQKRREEVPIATLQMNNETSRVSWTNTYPTKFHLSLFNEFKSSRESFSSNLIAGFAMFTFRQQWTQYQHHKITYVSIGAKEKEIRTVEKKKEEARTYISKSGKAYISLNWLMNKKLKHVFRSCYCYNITCTNCLWLPLFEKEKLKKICVICL